MGVQIDASTGNIIAQKLEYSGNVSIAGTLTYEDVTNVDSVGLITARDGITVSSGDIKVGSLLRSVRTTSSPLVLLLLLVFRGTLLVQQQVLYTDTATVTTGIVTTDRYHCKCN